MGNPILFDQSNSCLQPSFGPTGLLGHRRSLFRRKGEAHLAAVFAPHPVDML
jgi:hypothetical protein